MNDDQERAWKDAEQDHLFEEAKHQLSLWRLFWALVFLGGSGSLLWRFFYAEVNRE